MLRSCSGERRKLPTSSHVSAPSKLPIVTSNVVSPFFCQGCCLCMSVDFFAWIMMFRSSMVMLSCVDAKSSALLRRSWLMDG